MRILVTNKCKIDRDKTGGWVAGDVYLDRNLSVRTGLIARLL